MLTNMKQICKFIRAGKIFCKLKIMRRHNWNCLKSNVFKPGKTISA